jgi:D-alanyl-D-alanine carboxypeptidase
VARWLPAALEYVPQWVAYQARLHEIPGVQVAIARRGKLLLEAAFGVADLASGAKLTTKHQFRIASHSKTFTAAGAMKLVEAGRLRLDDPAGACVEGLNKQVGRATIAQLLSHTAGIVRDGSDAGQWDDRRPFLSEAELRKALAEDPILPANTRMKYTNHGFGLLGLVIAGVTGETYNDWIAREVVAKAGLEHTFPDAPTPQMKRLSRGHGSKILLGRRPVIPGENPTNALAPATGFISTAADLVGFFSQLDPAAGRSVLSVESRREMTRRHWRVPGISIELHYGLGTIGGDVGAWRWYGHSGGFQGFTTHTGHLPDQGLTVSVLTNAIDGAPMLLFDGVVRILQTFEKRGPPAKKLGAWLGRWWGTWGAFDLAPMGDTVLVASPGLANPFQDATELTVRDGDAAVISKAGGFAHMGEGARLVRDRKGKAREFWLGGSRLLPEAAAAKESERKYPQGA